MSAQFGRWSFDGLSAPPGIPCQGARDSFRMGRTEERRIPAQALTSLPRLPYDEGIPPGNSASRLRSGLRDHVGRAA